MKLVCNECFISVIRIYFPLLLTVYPGYLSRNEILSHLSLFVVVLCFWLGWLPSFDPTAFKARWQRIRRNVFRKYLPNFRPQIGRPIGISLSAIGFRMCTLYAMYWSHWIVGKLRWNSGAARKSKIRLFHGIWGVFMPFSVKINARSAGGGKYYPPPVFSR